MQTRFSGDRNLRMRDVTRGRAAAGSRPGLFHPETSVLADLGPMDCDFVLRAESVCVEAGSIGR